MKRNSDLRDRLSSRKGYESKRPRTEAQEEFDLISKENKSEVFKVTFDYYTPRAHFVILPRDGVQMGSEYNGLKAEQRHELVKFALNIISEFGLTKLATLAVHRGAWITTKHIFHAHVCADVDDYIQVFHKRKNDIPNWPSSRYVTKQWRASKNPREYEVNVRGYPFKTYVREEIQDVEEIRKKTTQKKDEVEVRETEFEGFRLLYHPKEPRVGFSVTKKDNISVDEYMKVLDAMNTFAGKNNMTDMNNKGDDKGCHLCVVFNGLENGFQLEGDSVLLGYLQMSGPKYYRDFCPDDIKESWFECFKSNPGYKVYT